MNTTAAEPDASPALSRWLDRWLEPRWRALLTWVALAVIATGLWTPPISIGLTSLQKDLLRPVPIAQLGMIGMIPFIAAPVFLETWFQPIVLRLGLVRTVIWITAAIGCHFATVFW